MAGDTGDNLAAPQLIGNKASNRRAHRIDYSPGIAAIYAPIVHDTAISFELGPPTVEEMGIRIANTVQCFPWLVSLDAFGEVSGYVYASKHCDRAAYQWSVDVTVYVRSDTRGQGIGKQLYKSLLNYLRERGYAQAFAGIALPNVASVALHESMGFMPLGVYRRVGYKLNS